MKEKRKRIKGSKIFLFTNIFINPQKIKYEAEIERHATAGNLYLSVTKNKTTHKIFENVKAINKKFLLKSLKSKNKGGNTQWNYKTKSYKGKFQRWYYTLHKIYI
jgi:hypothetical protein